MERERDLDFTDDESMSLVPIANGSEKNRRKVSERSFICSYASSYFEREIASQIEAFDISIAVQPVDKLVIYPGGVWMTALFN